MSPSPPRAGWLRIQEAADILGVSTSTMRRWAADGRVPCRRTPSGQRRFPRSELEAFATATILQGSPLPHSDAEQRYRLLLDTSLELASTFELSEVLQSAARRLTAALQIPDCDIYTLEDGNRMVCRASAVDGVYDATWADQEFRLEDWPCEQLAVESLHTVSVNSLRDPLLNETEREELRRYGQCSFITLPLVTRDEVIGLVDLLDHVERTFTEQEIATAEAVCGLVALAVEHARLYEEVKDLHLGNLRALSSALSAKDYYTLGHANRVASYMVLLADELGWPRDGLEEVENVAFLHDIGKIGVSDRVLLKGGPLTSEEWVLIRQHPGISAEIVRPLFKDSLVAGVRHHHERFDGKGYPDGLAGSEIPLLARALCVVDCYDAMSCERPYRHALSYRECCVELRRCAGTQFDPEMVAGFLAALRSLQAKRARVAALACQAAQLIDAAAHDQLRSRADEKHPAYARMVGSLRRLRDDNQPACFVTSFATVGEGCITILDTGETDDEVSHCGDPWLPEDELTRVLAGEDLVANVVTADDFGVWVSGIAPLRNAQGAVVGAVSVDAPVVESLGRSLRGDRSHALAAMLQSAAIRFSRAEVEAITDGLSGLYNHRYLHERLGEELERARQRKSALAVLFVDCDRFKGFNDLHGHKGGDLALKRVARTIESAGRRVDLAARYGGEEFVLALVDTDVAGGLIVAERIRSQVEAESIRGDAPLTVSIGVAGYPESAASKEELLDKADWAMYVAKNAGRNRVLAFSDVLVANETWLSRRGV
jgi:diguanylate cyclase (GGDEF)-like protein/excisionase family DNA binding protein